MTGVDLDEVRRRYTAEEPPPCRVCGGKLSIQSMGGGEPTQWACSDRPRDGDTDAWYDHFRRSYWTQYRHGDPDVLALADELADMRALFDLQWKRMGEATARWRAEDPEARALVMPDLGDLLMWLMGEADREHQRADGWADQYNRLARECADLRDERNTARDAERERIADWFEQEANVWRDRTGQTAVKCEYDHAAQMVRDLDPDGAR